LPEAGARKAGIPQPSILQPARLTPSRVRRRTLGHEELAAAVMASAEHTWNARADEQGRDVWYEFQRPVICSVIDRLWRDHMVALRELPDGTGMATLQRQDPLTQYQRDADELLDDLWTRLGPSATS
jgi:preprotein translocase subunit SecA